MPSLLVCSLYFNIQYNAEETVACPKTITSEQVGERKVVTRKNKWMTHWPLNSVSNGKSHAIDEKLPENMNCLINFVPKFYQQLIFNAYVHHL